MPFLSSLPWYTSAGRIVEELPFAGMMSNIPAVSLL
jgi:hypothetical protein